MYSTSLLYATPPVLRSAVRTSVLLERQPYANAHTHPHHACLLCHKHVQILKLSLFGGCDMLNSVCYFFRVCCDEELPFVSQGSRIFLCYKSAVVRPPGTCFKPSKCARVCLCTYVRTCVHEHTHTSFVAHRQSVLAIINTYTIHT